MPLPLPTPIYHITHLNNLPAIVGGGLVCCAELRAEKRPYHDLANGEIQDRRALHAVPVPPGGTLHDYVPFYFGPRSPMLYVVNRGGPRYPERQRPVVHLASTAQAVYAACGHCVFTDGHAIMAVSDYYTDLAHLGRIDWDVMVSRQWNDTPDAPGRKRKRQAEFLVHRRVPWGLVAEIGVVDQHVAGKVLELLEGETHRPQVRVRSEWYY